MTPRIVWACARHITPAFTQTIGDKRPQNGNFLFGPYGACLGPSHSTGGVHLTYEAWTIVFGFSGKGPRAMFTTPASIVGDCPCSTDMLSHSAVLNGIGHSAVRRHSFTVKVGIRRQRLTTDAKSATEERVSNSAIEGSNTDGHASPTASKSIADLEMQLSPYYREKRRKRDHILKTFTETVRISVINNTSSVAEARRRHGLSDVATKIVGRTMAAASMLAGWQYGEERIILSFEGNGPLNSITAEAIRTGEVRAFTANPKLIMPVGTPLGFALGHGSLKVTKILYNQAKPYHSVVPIAGADIASDLMQYYRLSEQIPAHVELETHVNHYGDVTFSGGLIIEALPPRETGQSNAKFIEPYIERLRRCPPMSVLFGEDLKSLRQVLDRIAPGEFAEDTVEKMVTDFYCRCSKDKFRKNLVTLGPDGLRQFFRLAGPEKTLRCHYCNTTYFLTESDMDILTDELSRLNSEALAKRSSADSGSPHE